MRIYLSFAAVPLRRVYATPDMACGPPCQAPIRSARLLWPVLCELDPTNPKPSMAWFFTKSKPLLDLKELDLVRVARSTRLEAPPLSFSHSKLPRIVVASICELGFAVMLLMNLIDILQNQIRSNWRARDYASYERWRTG